MGKALGQHELNAAFFLISFRPRRPGADPITVERCIHEHKYHLLYRFCRPDLDGRAVPDLPDANAANAGGQLQITDHVPGLRRHHGAI